jgi:nitrate reductase gamma subunit
MDNVYFFLKGPMMWISFIIFLIGVIYQIYRFFTLMKKKEAFMFSFFSLKYGLRSIFHWIVPFAATNMREQPAMTIVGFAFHLCLIITPIFLTAHIVLLKEAFNIGYWALPPVAADIMSVVVIAGCIFFLVRRIVRPEVHFVTSISDYILLLIVAIPFITGLWSVYQFPGYSFILLIHILSGQIMLMAIPFTRFIHMVFGIFSRAYTGSEFGGVRFARDW